jgi:hypothetical protein
VRERATVHLIDLTTLGSSTDHRLGICPDLPR